MEIAILILVWAFAQPPETNTQRLYPTEQVVVTKVNGKIHLSSIKTPSSPVQITDGRAPGQKVPYTYSHFVK